MNIESGPEKQTLSTESQERLRLINETQYQLENLNVFQLNTPEGREGLKLALITVFSNIEKIENEDKYEVLGDIKGRIRDTYTQLYGIDFTGEKGTSAAGEFYGEIGEIMELIETRGKRFIEDLDIYQRANPEEKAA